MATRLISRLSFVGAGLFASGAALAQTPPPEPAAAEAPAPPKSAVPKEAKPEAKRAPARTAKARRAKAKRGEVYEGPVASYPGFGMLDNDESRVTVEVNRKVDVTEIKGQGRITYRLRGVRVPARVVRLPLQTGFFKSPVSRVELVETADTTDLVIETREQVDPTHRVVETPRGMVLQIDFPKASKEYAPVIVPRAKRGNGDADNTDKPKKKRAGATKKLEGDDDDWGDNGSE